MQHYYLPCTVFKTNECRVCGHPTEHPIHRLPMIRCRCGASSPIKLPPLRECPACGHGPVVA